MNSISPVPLNNDTKANHKSRSNAVSPAPSTSKEKTEAYDNPAATINDEESHVTRI